jgi:hypothetical protein
MRSVKSSRDATNASGLRSYTHGTVVGSERVGAFSIGIARYDGIYLVRWSAATLALYELVYRGGEIGPWGGGPIYVALACPEALPSARGLKYR